MGAVPSANALKVATVCHHIRPADGLSSGKLGGAQIVNTAAALVVAPATFVTVTV